MARRGRSEASKRRNLNELAPKLIGLGLLLGIVPLFLGKSPFGAALRPMVTFGWLLFAAGCGLLWWQVRGRQPKAAAVVRPEKNVHPRPFRRPEEALPPVDRTATEFERMVVQSKARSARPEVVPQSWNAAVFEVIEWRRFEALIEALFAQAGFETKSQTHGADEGIDIWLYSRSNPGAPVSVVQCKHWQGKRVGVDKVRELRGVMAAKGVSRGQFATTSTFTDDAIKFAKANGVNLLDVEALLALIAQRTEEQQQALLAIALDGDYWRPTCVNCGTKMVERTPRKGGVAFWGCESYPKCKTTMPMRGAVGSGCGSVRTGRA
ncbi:MAG: restriction endonuclease [Rhizobacter sp.]|nr:restriction endonuclease [Rhizobacter sp.]